MEPLDIEKLQQEQHAKYLSPFANGKWKLKPIFEPWMADKIIEVMREGGSFVAAAVECGIGRSTLFEWKNPKSPMYIPDIGKACELGIELSQLWWEKQGQKGVWGGKEGFMPAAFSFQVKNRFKRDYADTPAPEIEEPTQNPLLDALKDTAETDWTPNEDLDDTGN